MPVLLSCAHLMDKAPFSRFSGKAVFTAMILTAIFLIWAVFIPGLRNDHIFLIILCLTLWFAHPASRSFISAFFVFVVYWVVYDSMRGFPNYTVNPVHVSEPYQLEKVIFGINTPSGRVTPNEWLAQYQHPVLDLTAGFFYINWVPVPLLFAFYLLRKDRNYFMRFAYSFVAANFTGFVIYYLYPAAPPWYVQEYGFDFDVSVPSNPAGLSRVDTILGFPLFHSIYSKNANIFAAIPSLHAAYPLLVVFYGFKRKMGWVNLLFILFAAGIWFAAVYSFHHYVIDLIAGAGCAVAGIVIAELIIGRKSKNKNQTLSSTSEIMTTGK